MKTVKEIQVYIEEAEDKSKSIQLPVVPASFMIDDGQNNVVVNITSLGNANLPGKKALRELTLNSFFPNQDYGFLVCKRKSNPYDYIEWLRKRKNGGTVMRVIITGTDINFTCLIEKLEYGEDDASGDVNYSIALKEYVKLTSSEKKTSGGNKNTGRSKKTAPKTYTVKKGDTLKSIAKKKLGSASKSKSLYKKNKKVIEDAFKKWKKKKNKKKKGSVKAKNSQNGKYLIKGTKLVL